METHTDTNAEDQKNFILVDNGMKMAFILIVLSFPSILHRFKVQYSFFSNFGFFENITSQYPTDWLRNISKETFQVKQARKKQLCNYEGSKKFKNSTPDDLIIGVLMGDVYGYEAFIRSLTSAGTNATVVIITNNSTLPNIPVLKVDFRLKIINVGELPKLFLKDRLLTKVPMFEFLAHFSHFFNRIVVTDIIDVVLQEDPFDSITNWNVLNFNFEHYTLEEEEANTVWVKRVNGWMLNKEMETEQINSGMIAGNPKIIKDLAVLMLYIWFLPEINYYPNDQGIIEYALLNHFYQDYGLDYSTRGRGPIGVFTRFHETMIELFPKVVARHSDEVAACMHKYFTEDIKEAVLRACYLYKTKRDPA